MLREPNKFKFLKLAQKALTVITTSIGVLSHTEGQSIQNSSHALDGNLLDYDSAQRKSVKPKLVLKLNPNFPEKRLLAQHSSHSSHSSHVSHSSHHSSSSGYSDDTSEESDGGKVLPLIVVGGALAVGGYLLGKKKDNKTK